MDSQDAFEPIHDDQAWMYADHADPPAEDRCEYDADHDGWLTRHSDR